MDPGEGVRCRIEVDITPGRPRARAQPLFPRAWLVGCGAASQQPPARLSRPGRDRSRKNPKGRALVNVPCPGRGPRGASFHSSDAALPGPKSAPRGPAREQAGGLASLVALWSSSLPLGAAAFRAECVSLVGGGSLRRRPGVVSLPPKGDCSLRARTRTGPGSGRKRDAGNFSERELVQSRTTDDDLPARTEPRPPP